MRRKSIFSRLGPIVLAVVLCGGCASSFSSHAPAGPTSSATPTPGLSVQPVLSEGPGGTDPDSHVGSFGPLPSGTDTSQFLSAADVQARLLKDGASADWVRPSSTLRVELGQYIPDEVPPTLDSTVPTPTPGRPIDAYRFSGDTGTCPASAGGGTSTNSPSTSTPERCEGSVMADATTGDPVFVQTFP